MKPTKITEQEAGELSLISSCLVALDEHMAIQMTARGYLVQQRVEWWNKIRAIYDLRGEEKMTLDTLEGLITSVSPEKENL
jgi:hypothetical protein